MARTSRSPVALRSMRRRWRGFVVLHRRWLVALVVGLAALTGLRAVAPPPAPTVPVVVAAHDLPGGGVLTGDDVEVRQLPADLTPSGSVGSAAAVLGRTLAAPVRTGEVVTDRRVLAAGLLDAHPGAVAVPVRVADAGIRGLLRVGDLVRLVAAAPRASSAAVVADAVPVLALPRPAGDHAEAGTSGALVVVAVPEADAVAVTQASAAGVVSVVLLG